MARGFESKDVEFQQAEAERLTRGVTQKTPVDRDRADRRRALELSLTRMQQELTRATAVAHRHMIETAITSLQQHLAELAAE